MIEEDNQFAPTKLDYTLNTQAERAAFVDKLLKEAPPEHITNRYLTYLSDYIISAMSDADKKEGKILTDNRMTTVNKRETSYEGLVGKLENGEDGIYCMMSNDRNIILSPKKPITEKDIEDIPELADLINRIEDLKKEIDAASGKKKFALKKMLKEMYQEQYVIKNAFKPIQYSTKLVPTTELITFDEKIIITADGDVQGDGKTISFFDPKHISAILCNYSRLKQDSWGVFNKDTFYMMIDFDRLVDAALAEKYPLYLDVIILKIDGKTNLEIQEEILHKYGIKHTVEHISALWRNKIPKIIAEKAKDEYLIWYYTNEERGHWKKCNRCGQIKLAHSRFFSKNSSSNDGFYSICKACRSTKNKEEK